MKEILRVSPVKFNSTPVKTQKKDNWNVVLEYAAEGSGPWLTDLSHRPRFDFQDADIDAKKPFDTDIPETPGGTAINKGLVINRMNQTQASIYNLAKENDVNLPDETGYTDVTESTICVALFGKSVSLICEKLTALDFMEPEKTAPFLLQGPFSHVPCQIVTLNKAGDTMGIVLTCSRGYGRDMIHAILDAGEEFNLKPAGELRFKEWMLNL